MLPQEEIDDDIGDDNDHTSDNKGGDYDDGYLPNTRWLVTCEGGDLSNANDGDLSNANDGDLPNANDGDLSNANDGDLSNAR